MEPQQTLTEILNLSPRKAAKITGALFAYLFYRINQEQFIEYIGDNVEGRRIKDIARVNGYILKNCKLYAYAVHVAKSRNEKIPSYREFGVTEADSRILRRLNLQHLGNYRAFTLKEFDSLLLHVTMGKDMLAFMGRFISKKMMFLIKSYSVSRTDIEAMLKEAAILAVYKQYPRYDNLLHFTNVAKASIHNAGHSFISFHTAKTRQKLRRNDDGSHESVDVSLSAVSVDLAIDDNAWHTRELKDSIATLVALEAKMSTRVQDFIMCLAGQFNAGLSEFMEVDSNSEAVENMNYTRYLHKVQSYFGVNELQTRRLFDKLRKHL